MEPVEIDFIIGGNVAAEGARVEQTFDEITASVNLLTSNIDRHKTAIVDLQKDLVSLGIAYKQATKADKSGILEEIELTKKNLIDEKAAVISLTAEVRQLEKQKKAAAVVADDTNTMAQNAGKAAVGYNGLGTAVQQIVREAPAATMGLNMFFLAISNNIPILRDAIARTKAENEALKASGQTSVPVWKQLAGSLFSWQSLMMVGITLLSMYGKDLAAWVAKLFGAQQAIDKTAESQKAMNKVFSDFTGDASRKIQDVTRLGIEIDKYGNNAQNAKSIISEFNKTFNVHYTTIQQVKNAYPELSKAAIESAIKIQAANSLIQKSAQYTLQKQQADTALAPYSDKQIAEQEKMINKLFSYAKKRGYDFNELTTELTKGERPSLLDTYSKWFTAGNLSGEQNDLKEWFSNSDNLWFAKYITQQRKSTKQIDLNNKEIQKSLSGVDFKDFTNENLSKDTKPKNEKQYYDAAKAMGQLITDVEKETGNLILQAQDDFLQTKLDKVSIEQENELALIKQKSKDIVDEYNKSHKNDKGFKPLSTKDEDLTASLTTVSPKKDEKTGLTQSEQLEKDITKITKAYADKRAKIQQDYYDEVNKLAEGMADARVKIEQEYEDKIKKERANGAEAYAQQLEIERDKKISTTTAQMIEETDLYKMATDSQLNLGKELNAKLIQQAKERIKTEMALGKLSQADGNKMLGAIDKSQAEQVSGSLSDFIDKYRQLADAKNRLAQAKESGDFKGAAQASTEVDALSKSVEGYGQKMQSVMSTANSFAGQAIDLLNAMSTEEGDAASSAAKSIGAVMDVANATMQGFQQGGYVGAAVAFTMSVATKVFEAEKAHKKALAELEKARNDTQKEYNDLLMKQNKLLSAAETIFGTNGMAQANAYAAQMKAYSDALYSKESTTRSAGGLAGIMGATTTDYKGAIAALNNATIQTGSHKTGLFGWGGEKADYSGLLATYPALIDGQGKLNKELAQSVLDNGKLNDSSKAALQSALDYTEAYDEALKNLQSYLNSIFGDLGGELMDAITSNLDDAQAAIDDFGDYVGEAMKKMISDIAYNIYFAKMFNELSDKVTAIYSDSSTTDKQKADAAATAVGNFYNGIDDAVAGATKFVNDMYTSISDKTGIDMYNTDSTAKGIQGDVKNMTEDTGSALVGAINAMRLNVVELLKNSNLSLAQLANILSALEEIKDNTSFCKKLERIDEDIHYLKQNGIKVL